MNTLLKSGFTAIIGALLISGCGGGGGSSDSDQEGSTVASRGAITGFGSVYVNGVRYHTGNTDFRVDDRNSDESKLRVGMIVTVLGTLLGPSEGIANSIFYDNELKGPISAITPHPTDASSKTLTILGQSVIVNAQTIIDNKGGLSFDTLAVGDFLEVSAYITDSGLTASYIELQNDDDVEITGVIANLTGNSFTINGFPVSYNGGTELDDIQTLSNGLFVEVEGHLDVAGTTIIAEEIEAEDDFFDDDYDQFEIKGVISNYNAGNKSFMLQGIEVDASSARLKPASLMLADGMTVEVEGFLSNGVLVAREVEQKGRKVKIDAPLSAVDTGASTVSFSFNGSTITVRVNSGTEIEDDNTGNNLILADLSAGNFVELEAFIENSGLLNAQEIERTDPDEISIEAPVEAFDAGIQSVTLLGIAFDLSAASFEDDNDNNLSSAQFFDALTIGRMIEIEDEDRNAVFDEAKLDD